MAGVKAANQTQRGRGDQKNLNARAQEVNANGLGKGFLLFGRSTQQAPKALAIDDPVQQQGQQHHRKTSVVIEQQFAHFTEAVGHIGVGTVQATRGGTQGFGLHHRDPAQLHQPQGEQGVVKAFQAGGGDGNDHAGQQAHHTPYTNHAPPGQTKGDGQPGPGVGRRTDHGQGGQGEDARRADDQRPHNVDGGIQQKNRRSRQQAVAVQPNARQRRDDGQSQQTQSPPNGFFVHEFFFTRQGFGVVQTLELQHRAPGKGVTQA